MFGDLFTVIIVTNLFLMFAALFAIIVVMNLFCGPTAVMLFETLLVASVVVVVHDFRPAVLTAGLGAAFRPAVINTGFRVMHLGSRYGKNIGRGRGVSVGEDVLADDGRSQAHGESFPTVALFGAGIAG